MNFTDNPFEKMMKQVPRAYLPEARKPPPGSPCRDCSYWRGGKAMDSRELTRGERAAIRKLVTGMCANYDSSYGCLPLDYGGCYMLDKWWTGAYCKYFQNAVLPLAPVLEATLTGREVPALDSCAICGKPFVPEGKQAYCSPACANAARRKRQRGYMRKKRGNC